MPRLVFMGWRISKALRVGVTSYMLALHREFAGEPVDVVALVDVLSADRPHAALLKVERVDGADEHMRGSAAHWLLGDGELEALLACSIEHRRVA